MNRKKKDLPIRRRKVSKTFIFLFLGVLFFSCMEETATYRSYQSIKQGEWEKENPYLFTFDIDRNDITYDLTLLLRNNNRYPYQNIWICYELSDTSGIQFRDTMECILANKHGQWAGKGISLFEMESSIRQSYQFPHTGKMTISFKHDMQKEKLDGLELIGLDVRSGFKSSFFPGSVQPEENK